MAHVKLKQTDLEVIIEITQAVCDFKFRALRKSSWMKFQTEYLSKLISQITDNEFICNDFNNNTALWLIDQICWSRQVIPGVPIKDGSPLADSALGERALEILRAASKGQSHYDSWSRPTTFHNLFE